MGHVRVQMRAQRRPLPVGVTEWHARHPAPTLSVFMRAGGAHVFDNNGVQYRVPLPGDTGYDKLSNPERALWWVVRAAQRRRGACAPGVGTSPTLYTRKGEVGRMAIMSVFERPSGASGFVVVANEPEALQQLRKKHNTKARV